MSAEATLKAYVLKSGQYIGADFTQAKCPLEFSDGKPKTDRKGNQIIGHPSRKFNIGEVVVSPIDLREKHGKQFEYVGPYTPTAPTPTPADAPSSNGVGKRFGYTEAQLNEMTLDQLTALAAEEEITLGAAKGKPAIVKAILAARS